MAKAVTTIRLNDLQLATAEELRQLAQNRIVNRQIAGNYKQNVINALVRRGVLRSLANGHYRIPANVEITLKPETVHRNSAVADAVAAA